MSKPGLVRLLQAPFLVLSALLSTVGLAIRLVGLVFGWLAWPFVKLGVAVGALASLYLVLAGEDEARFRARSYGEAFGRMRSRYPGSGLWATRWTPRGHRPEPMSRAGDTGATEV